MPKELLENKIGQSISDWEFKEVMQMTDDDIKFNFIDFNKRITPDEKLIIAVRCATALKRCM